MSKISTSHRIALSLVALFATLLVGCTLLHEPPPPFLGMPFVGCDPNPPHSLGVKVRIVEPIEAAFIAWRLGDPQGAASRIEVMDGNDVLVYSQNLVPTNGVPHPILAEVEWARKEALSKGLPEIVTELLTIIEDTTDQGTSLPDEYRIVGTFYVAGAATPATCYASR